ncbi:hypothetical protein MBLNU459_g5933t1 [Dothideomycetes sp. NU459]
MSYTITPMTPADVPDYTWIHYHAFDDSPGSVSAVFYTAGLNEHITAHLNRIQTKGLTDPANRYILLRDPATSTLVGIAKWVIQTADKTPAELDQEEEQARHERATQAPVPGINKPGVEAFREAQAQSHREHMQGRAHVYLALLAAHPDHQRKGVGATAMAWGVAEAEKLGLPIYLESSKEGYGLYEKFGFKTVGIFPFDAGQFGHKGNATHYCMVRPARTGTA